MPVRERRRKSEFASIEQNVVLQTHKYVGRDCRGVFWGWEVSRQRVRYRSSGLDASFEYGAAISIAVSSSVPTEKYPSHAFFTSLFRNPKTYAFAAPCQGENMLENVATSQVLLSFVSFAAYGRDVD